jgi:endonuclease YncB( thermonuclease family)
VFLLGAVAVTAYTRIVPASISLPPLVTAPRPAERAVTFGLCRSGTDRTCVVDGDTIRMGGEVMRLASIDAPETYRNLCGGAREVELGNRAKARLHELLGQGPVSISRHGTDRYGRTLVTVRLRGRDVGDQLVAERLARTWPDGPEWWCN